MQKGVKKKMHDIIGFSYIGAPKSNTAMFITKKVETLLLRLIDVDGCLIFAEKGIQVPGDISDKHTFVFSERPQLDYARYAKDYAEKKFKKESLLKYKLTEKGYYVCEDVKIPKDAYIEPGCIIGPDVKLGVNARIYARTVIKHAIIGDNSIANEGAVIGASGFTMAEDENGNKIRIPTLGRVIIGNDVEIGTQNNISCGSGGDTIIEDYVKLDALIHIAHDVHIKKNSEITAGVTFGGFVEVGTKSFVGLGSVLRNRIIVGDDCYIGMGSNVTKTIEGGKTVAGNPAKPLERNH